MEFWRYRRQPDEDQRPIASLPVRNAAFKEGLRQGGLAAHEGSFSRGGAVVDETLSAATDRTRLAGAQAASQAGAAVKTAGDKIQRTASDVAAPKH
jgi:hypothetical protein